MTEWLKWLQVQFSLTSWQGADMTDYLQTGYYAVHAWESVRSLQGTLDYSYLSLLMIKLQDVTKFVINGVVILS